jgi:hypothetical protein
MSNPTGIFDKTLCYLSQDAKNAVNELVGMGLDRDLAVSILEGFYGESIYELPVEDDIKNRRQYGDDQ